SAGANIITGGAGNDTIDGGGGADIIAAGTGNDIVFVHGDEIAIDGGDGNDTLVLPASSKVAAVSFAVASGLDQTAGDSTAVANFTNVDAGAVSIGVSILGTAAANTITGGAGADIIDGGGGADVIGAGAGADTVTLHGNEISIDGGTGSDTLLL